MADNTLVCGVRFEQAKHITLSVVQKKHFLNFSSNSEANVDIFNEQKKSRF